MGVSGYTIPGYASSPTIVSYNDLTQAGFWGVPASGNGGGIVPNASTSADQSIIHNFSPGNGVGADILQFSVAAWFYGGLTDGDGNTPVFNPPNNSLPLNAVIDAALSGATLSAKANVIELTGATFVNASALATALGSTYKVDNALRS